jgi:hypothetical protein
MPSRRRELDVDCATRRRFGDAYGGYVAGLHLVRVECCIVGFFCVPDQRTRQRHSGSSGGSQWKPGSASDRCVCQRRGRDYRPDRGALRFFDFAAQRGAGGRRRRGRCSGRGDDRLFVDERLERGVDHGHRRQLGQRQRLCGFVGCRQRGRRAQRNSNCGRASVHRVGTRGPLRSACASVSANDGSNAATTAAATAATACLQLRRGADKRDIQRGRRKRHHRGHDDGGLRVDRGFKQSRLDLSHVGRQRNRRRFSEVRREGQPGQEAADGPSDNRGSHRHRRPGCIVEGPLNGEVPLGEPTRTDFRPRSVRRWTEWARSIHADRPTAGHDGGTSG